MNNELTLVEHLEELRKRIIICLVAALVCTIACYFYVDKILLLVAAPVGHLVFLKPAEAFIVRIKVAFYGGIFVSMPVILYQAWKFVSPGLFKAERKYVYLLILFSYLLFVFGVVFAYRLVLPPAMKYLLDSGGPGIQPMISVGYYVSFITMFLLGFGLVFQLPLLLLFLVKINVITPKWLSVNRKYAILAVFIIAGVITPGPDIFSQLMMAVPLLVLYEITV
ncbi:MAG: twin arginine-targeting protein translocase TatC, partial [Elusimicrobia bacterium RIFOXYB2_FULL_48_7]